MAGKVPAEVVMYYPGFVEPFRREAFAPFALAGYGFGIRIQKVFCFVKNQALFGIVRSVNGIGVFKFVDF